jgi:methylase of polypeptide subunit release factors
VAGRTVARRHAATDVERVRALLERADYTEAGIRAIGVDPGLGVRRPDVPVLLRVLQPTEPLASLVRLFLLAQDVDRKELRRRLGAADLDALVGAGLAVERGARVAPLVQLTPWHGLLIPHDPDPEGELWPEHVSGPTPAAETLAQLIVGGAVGTALDLGTGSGLLALLLGRQARSVVATDVNPAALRYAALGAVLNDEPNVDVREGSLFESVGGARYDRIVSNPPFVIAPDASLLFRHSGMPSDELSRLVVEGATAHLEEDGFGAILCNWVVPRGASWLDAVRPWVEDRGCDAVVLLHGVEDPLSYAVRWNGRSQYLAPAEFGRLLGRWLEHDRKQGIEAIASGAVVLRRRAGTNWTHGVQLEGEARGDGGEHLRTLFAAGEYLAGNGGQPAILASAFALSAPHRLEQTLVSRDGDYVVEPARLLLENSVGTTVTLDPDLIPLVLRLDGRQRLREVVDDVAAASGVDPGGLTSRAVALVQSLLERGYLEPPSGSD